VLYARPRFTSMVSHRTTPHHTTPHHTTPHHTTPHHTTPTLLQRAHIHETQSFHSLHLCMASR
jgi:hypothetical protein